MSNNTNIDEDKISGPPSIMDKPPTLDDLEPGQVVMVRLFANQLGPSNPRLPSTYVYSRAGNQLFRYLVEEVR